MTKRAGAGGRGYHHGNLAEALLRGAVEAVRQEGASHVSLRQLAAGLGVDPAALYRHYENKEALLAAVAGEGFSTLARRMEAGQARESDARARFLALGRAYVRFALGEPHLFRLMFGPLGAGPGAPARPPGTGETGRTSFQLLEEALAALDLDGSLGRELALHAGTAWAAVHGLASLLVDGPLRQLPRAEVERRIDAVCETVLRGLLAG